MTLETTPQGGQTTTQVSPGASEFRTFSIGLYWRGGLGAGSVKG